MIITEDFAAAIKIYKFLLEKRFPQRAILKLVGDRFKLNSTERTILYRGVCTDKNARHRKSKLAFTKDIQNKRIHIDGYNVLITIGSYLNGSLVFIGNDNFLRDASEVHGKVFRTELLQRAIALTFDYLKKNKVSGLHFYLDKPVSNSGRLSAKLNNYIQDHKFSGSAKTVNSPDFVLKKVNKDIIATSDSSIIDNCKVTVIDLARKILTHNFKPKYLNLTIRNS